MDPTTAPPFSFGFQIDPDNGTACGEEGDDSALQSIPHSARSIGSCEWLSAEDHRRHWAGVSENNWEWDEVHLVPKNFSSVTPHNASWRTMRRIRSKIRTATDGRVDEKSDLIPGAYGGGLKVWECSLDLCAYIVGEMEEPLTGASGGCNIVRSVARQGGSVLELGCGHGLPGILVLRSAQDAVNDPERAGSFPSIVFADMNDFVLRDVTYPNVVLNLGARDGDGGPPRLEARLDSAGAIRFVSGDWLAASEDIASGRGASTIVPKTILTGGMFDLILASETTYDAESARDTATLMFRHLKRGGDNGIGLIATKRYYFGVGGGSGAFRDAVDDLNLKAAGNGGHSLLLVVDTVRVMDDGKSNIREILRVRFSRRDSAE